MAHENFLQKTVCIQVVYMQTGMTLNGDFRICEKRGSHLTEIKLVYLDERK